MRWRLAGWYAGVMGIILSLCGLGVYQAIVHAHWVAVEGELKSVAGTLHDSIEPLLKQPGHLELDIQQLLPDICLAGVPCTTPQASSKRHILGAVNQAKYYMRLFDSSGRLIALSGRPPDELPATLGKESLQTLCDLKGNRYQQISLLLHTQDNLFWGYLQVGRSLKDLDDYLTSVRWILGLGLPVAIGAGCCF